MTNDSLPTPSLHIIGIGNNWAMDDGIGPAVVEALRVRLLQGYVVGPQDVHCSILSQPGLGLLEALEGCDHVIIVDAVVSDAPYGTLHRLEWEPGLILDRGIQRVSSHGYGVQEVLDLAMNVGRLPLHVELWGIEAASMQPGEGLTPALRRVFPQVVDQLYTYVLQTLDIEPPSTAPSRQTASAV